MAWEMELNDAMLEDLYEWIDKIPLSRQKRRIERDFSDGYCVGEIVKHFLPHHIELHNLTPAHNIQQKIANWGWLNAKVFSKFGLNVPLNITQNISNGKPGYIEVLLYNLRYKIEEKLNEIELKKEHQRSKSSPRLNNSSLSHRTKVPTQLRIEYEEKVQECLQQAEEIEVLNAKVRRLEHLLELKEIRISELTEKLDKYRPTGLSAEPPSLLKKASSTKNSISIS